MRQCAHAPMRLCALGAKVAGPYNRKDMSESRPVPGSGEPVKVVDRRWWARGEDAPTPENTVGKPSYVEELEQRLAERDRQVQQALQQLKAASTEYDEARVRARREVVKEVERSKRAMLGELLEVLDNLDRALDAGTTAKSVDALLQGVRLVRSQFLNRLESLGITTLDALNQPFDPTLHEAVTTVPVTSPENDERVVGVVRPGYRIGNEILRPAMVAVGKHG
jgi:molecular chaperone GrpE